jgi:hypothetical protein
MGEQPAGGRATAGPVVQFALPVGMLVPAATVVQQLGADGQARSSAGGQPPVAAAIGWATGQEQLHLWLEQSARLSQQVVAGPLQWGLAVSNVAGTLRVQVHFSPQYAGLLLGIGASGGGVGGWRWRRPRWTGSGRRSGAVSAGAATLPANSRGISGSRPGMPCGQCSNWPTFFGRGAGGKQAQHLLGLVNPRVPGAFAPGRSRAVSSSSDPLVRWVGSDAG